MLLFLNRVEFGIILLRAYVSSQLSIRPDSILLCHEAEQPFDIFPTIFQFSWYKVVFDCKCYFEFFLVLEMENLISRNILIVGAQHRIIPRVQMDELNCRIKNNCCRDEESYHATCSRCHRVLPFDIETRHGFTKGIEGLQNSASLPLLEI